MKRSTKRVALALLFAGFLGLSIYATAIVSRNFAGYCAAEGRYMPDKERIDKAVHGILGHYLSINFIQDSMPTFLSPAMRDKNSHSFDNTTKGIEITQSQLVPYADIAEFLAINPECCSFDRQPLYSHYSIYSDFWGRAFGDSAGYTNVRYLIRFRNSKGEVQSKLTGDSYHWTNCGHSTKF